MICRERVDRLKLEEFCSTRRATDRLFQPVLTARETLTDGACVVRFPLSRAEAHAAETEATHRHPRPAERRVLHAPSVRRPVTKDCLSPWGGCGSVPGGGDGPGAPVGDDQEPASRAGGRGRPPSRRSVPVEPKVGRTSRRGDVSAGQWDALRSEGGRSDGGTRIKATGYAASAACESCREAGWESRPGGSVK